MVSAVSSGGVGQVGFSIQNNVAAPVKETAPVTKVTVLPNLIERLKQIEGTPGYAQAAVGVLVTDGAAHSPAAWAEITVAQLIQIESTHQGNYAHEFKANVQQCLAIEFIEIIRAEQRHLQQDEARLNAPVDLAAIGAAIVRKISVIAGDTQWADHYRNPVAIEAMIGVIIKDVATMMLIERELYAKAQIAHGSALAASFLAEVEALRAAA